MKQFINKIVNNLIPIIIVIQPILDILSYFEVKLLGSSHSWILRIIILLIVFGITYFKSKSKKKLFLCLLPFAIFFIFHVLNLYRIKSLNILLDTKYFILVFQMPVLTILLIDYLNSTHLKLDHIKKSLLISTFIIAISIIISYITKSYETTYEYVGITGWFSSANTQSMILCALAPWLLYMCSCAKKTWVYFFGCIAVFLLLYTNGTRACYYTLIALSAMFIFALAFSKNEKNRIIKIIFTTLLIILPIATYKFSFTFNKEDIARDVTSQNINQIKKILVDSSSDKNGNKGKIQLKEGELDIDDIDFDSIDLSDSQLIAEILKTSYLYDDLINIHGEEKVIEFMKPHLSAAALSNNRLSKIINAKIEYSEADKLTKVLGIGYSCIEKNSLDMENDLQAIFYYYGYLGFSIYLIFVAYFILKAGISFLKDFKLIHNKEFITLCFLILLLVAGGEYSGALLRKPNANIYLSIYLVLLYFVLCKNTWSEKKINKKKITFLLLHLGYGGIETSTINTANALSDYYDIEIISFYNLANNQSNMLNGKIKIKYLYNGEPNKNEFITALKRKNLLLIIKEGLKSISILTKKKYLIKEEILKSDSFAIISTRCDFSVLLNEYGADNIIKIAQEHHHHNNNRKYINRLKKQYKNIDYLFALTDSLKSDYEKFLKHNKKTKIVVVPNMLTKSEDNLISDLSSRNIVSIGRLHEDKRIIDLIDIFSKTDNSDNKLYIIGDGEEKEKLESHIKELSLDKRVILTGYLNKNQQKTYLENSSVFAMTSISEGLPMVLLEAMDCGIPCIAYATDSGTKDIIKNNINGFIIENRDEKEYIAKLDLLLSNENLRKKFSTDCKETAQKYYKENIVKKWINILSD